MTKVIRLKKGSYRRPDKTKRQLKFNIINSDSVKIAFMIISVISVFIGCVAFKNNSIDYVTELCGNTINYFRNESYFDILLYIFKYELILYLLVFFIGTSMIGIPLTPFPVILKSVFIGYFSSYIYCEYEIKGILFLLILFYPMTIITTTSLIYAAYESLLMSKYILRSTISKNTADAFSIRLYLIRYIVLSGMSVACIAVNSFVISVLAEKFNLQQIC